MLTQGAWVEVINSPGAADHLVALLKIHLFVRGHFLVFFVTFMVIHCKRHKIIPLDSFVCASFSE